MGNRLGEFFAFLRDVAEDQGDRRDLVVLGELLDELLTLRLGFAVTTDSTQRDDVVVVGTGDPAESGAVLEDIEEGDMGFPGALELEQAEADAVGDERVVVLVRGELLLDLLELGSLQLDPLDIRGLFRIRLGEILGQGVCFGLLAFDCPAERIGEAGAAQRALVVGQCLTVEVASEVLVGGRFGGGETCVTDFEALEIRADDLDGRAAALGVNLVLELARFLRETELSVHLDELIRGFAAFGSADAVGGGLLEQADGLGVGGFLGLFRCALVAVDDDLGREREGVHAIFGAGECVGADLLESCQGEVPLALLRESFDEQEFGGAAAVIAVEEVLGTSGELI